MASKKMIKSLNEQLNKELFSSYLYLSMSAYFEEDNLNGMAAWMRFQSQEEYAHAMKFYDFIHKIGGRVKLAQIDTPKDKWENPLAAFKEAYEHEKFISKSIHEIVDLAMEEKDHAARSFLNWFVDEQVEEEENANLIVEKFKMIGDNKTALYMLDKELGARNS